VTVTMPDPVRPAPLAEPIRMLWLEVTGRCQLTCTHCYAASSPTGSHGSMHLAEWIEVITQAAAAGVEKVCLIGGEPTLYPAFPELVAAALAAGLAVEVYTNLYALPARVWDTLTQPGVSVATSYYAAEPAGHDAITGRSGSHAHTRTNLRRLVNAGVPVRAGVIATAGDDQAAAAVADLAELGVAAKVDHVRPFGRAADRDDEAGSCGRCGHGRAAIGADGTVTPCVFTRQAVAGNVRTDGLLGALGSTAFRAQVARLDRSRARVVRRPGADGCSPDDSACGPDSDACGPDFPEVGA